MELFARPLYLFYFIPAALVTLLVFWAGTRLKRRAVRALFGSAAYAKLTANLRPESRWRTVLFLAAEFFLFAAMAGPQWGTEIIEAQGEFAQAVIAVDVSASMRARDLKPDRLDNAKKMLGMLVNNLKNERIGIIAFTSQAYVQCPITTDADALQYFISALRPDMLPVNGTSLAAPVSLAARMLAKYPGQKALILLTDGEDHEPKELETAEQTAAKYGVRVIAIGIGSKEGTLIPFRTDASGKVLEYKKDKQGNTVVSKLDEKALASLAQATGGAYIAYTTPAQVAGKVEEAVRGLDRTLSAAVKRTTYKNRYQIPLALALLCLTGYLLWPVGRKPQTSGGEKDPQKR